MRMVGLKSMHDRFECLRRSKRLLGGNGLGQFGRLGSPQRIGILIQSQPF